MEDFGNQFDNMDLGKKTNKGMEEMIIDVFDKIDANMIKLIDEIKTTLAEGNRKDSDW